MYVIHQQVKAQLDLKQIWLYSLREFGEAQADNYYDQLIDGINTIRDNPEIGFPCDYIRIGYRQYKVKQHFIFYRIGKGKIHIVRVLHESMQVVNYLK